MSTVLQGLLDKYQLSPSQVNCQIQQVDIPCFTAYFDNVDFYVDLMELTTGEQTDVEGAKTNQLAVIKCLKIWKGKNPEQATFNASGDVGKVKEGRDCRSNLSVLKSEFVCTLRISRLL